MAKKRLYQKATRQQFGSQHPLVNEDNHDKLLAYVKDRLDFGRPVRDSLRTRLTNIDKDLAAFVKLDDVDKKRMRDNRSGKGPKVVQVDLPLAMAKIDEMLTFLMTVFFPQDGMYSAYTNYTQQPVANGLAQILNVNAKKRGHYRKTAKFLFDALKYNIAAMAVEWQEDKAAKIGRDLTGGVQVKKDEVSWRGNELTNIDIYNFIFDPTVQPVDLPKKGEFASIIKMYSKYAVKRMAAQGTLWNADEWLDSSNAAVATYWVPPPTVRYDYNADAGQIDWFKFALGDSASSVGGGLELATTYIMLNPAEFGLSQDNEMQVWRIIMVNGQHIAACDRMNNAHEELPVVVAVPNEDQLGLQQRSPAENLTDLQRFASFNLNIHQQASRKALWGLTVYNPNLIDMSGHEDGVAGTVSMKTNALDKPVDQAIKQFNDAPKTDGTMPTIEKCIELMEVILPTNQLKQVADLQRATEFQAAATVQASNRRHYKLAKIIDDQAFSSLRRQEVMNTVQYQPQVTIPGPDGQPMVINPAQFDETQIEAAIGAGLQSMDKLMYIGYIQQIINSILQSQQAIAEIDILGLLNYMSSLVGDKTDLTQFRKQLPPQQPQVDPNQPQQQEMTPEQQQAYISQLQATQNLQALARR